MALGEKMVRQRQTSSGLPPLGEKERNKPYKIAYERWVKIWFSVNPSIAIPDKQKNHIDEALAMSSQMKMTLVYSSDLLDDVGKAQLAQQKVEWNDKYPGQLQLLDINDPAFKAEVDRDQTTVKLYRKGLEELNFDKGGNVGAASDCIRLLTCRHGVYSDFDVSYTQVLKEALNQPDTSTKSFFSDRALLASVMDGTANNDVIAVSKDAIPAILVQWQEEIIEGYQRFQRETVAVFMSAQIFMGGLPEKLPEKLEILGHKTMTVFDFRKEILDCVEQEGQDFINEKITQADFEERLSVYKKTYMLTVSAITGPKNMPATLKLENFGSSPLFRYVLPQGKGSKADLSWVPPALKISHYEEKKKIASSRFNDFKRQVQAVDPENKSPKKPLSPRG